MIRSVLSIVIAVAASLIGHFSLWTAGAVLVMQLGRFDSQGAGVSLPAIAGVLFGMLAIVIATLTVRFSSAGVITLGAVHVVIGLVSMLSVYQPFGGGFAPVHEVMLGANWISEELSAGMFFSIPTGIFLLVGVILLGSGLAAIWRHGPAGPIARTLAGVVGLFAGLPGVALLLAGGSRLYESQLRRMADGIDTFGIALALVGVLLVAVAVLTVRWSSLGLVLLGGAVAVLGYAGLFAPQVFFEAAMGQSREVAAVVLIAPPSGNLALIGVVLLAAGLAVRSRALRRAVLSEPLSV